MDSPFFRSYLNQPSQFRYSPTSRGIPVQPAHRKAAAATTPSPKVVSIPVHFVGSEASRSASTLKIQKVFRGFLVRKSMKKIADIRREVEAVERMLMKSDTIELIRRDSKERLKVSETLMALLFKLDSVRGVDSGVRDCRKAVIKKVIALQEKVDDIVAGNHVLIAENTVGNTDESDVLAEAVDQTLDFEPNAMNQALKIQGEAPGVEDHLNGSIYSNQVSEANVVANQTLSAEIDVENTSESGVIAEAVDHALEIEASVDSVLKIQGEAPGVEDHLNGSIYSNQVSEANVVANQTLSTEIDVDNTSESGVLAEAVDHTLEIEASVDSGPSLVNQPLEIKEAADFGANHPVEIEGKTSGIAVYHSNVTENSKQDSEIEEANNDGLVDSKMLSDQTCTENVALHCDVDSEEEACVVKHIIRDQCEVDESVDLGEDEVKPLSANNLRESGVETGTRRENNKDTKEHMERMMEENEKMMSMIKQLCERNESQSLMLSLLAQRVEQLEKAFICDRLRKKNKKKRQANGVTDGVESTPDQKKCGKR